jgi:signal transduction histidine kinase
MFAQRQKADSATQSVDHETVPFLLAGTRETIIWLAWMLGVLLCLFAAVQVAVHSPRVPLWALGLMAVLYLLGLGLLAVMRFAPDRRLILWGLGGVLVLACCLILTFASLLGAVLFEVIPVVVVYRLPWRWSLPIMGITGALFVGSHLLYSLVLSSIALHSPLLASAPNALSDIWTDLGALVLIVFIAGTTRARAVLILQLRATQERLRVEMEHTAELAAARERARIARDIHDVLAHSLTMLSVQVQAARQIVLRDPEQTAQMLDEMAGVLRESIAESRRAVGMLRAAVQRDETLRARLLALADRFADRTGMSCQLCETGQPQQLSPEHESTLRFALQEALTNACRHGGAKQVRAELAWQPETVTLTVHDDGAGQSGPPSGGNAGNGLRGMHERAAAIGGSLLVGPHEGEGFAVSVVLPLPASEVQT